MRSLLLGGSVVSAMMLFSSSLLQPAAAQDAKLPFSTGERLRYAVSWRGLPAGHAEITVSADRSAVGRWKASATAKSVGYVSNIYPVEDAYQSQFRHPGFCSTGIHKQIQEGDRHREVRLQFDAQRRVARLEDRNMVDHTPPKMEQFAIPECVLDILSAVYYARSLPLPVGKSFEFPLNDGAKTIQIHVDVQAEETITTEAGKFQAIRVEPDVFSGHLFTGKGRMFIWFTKDARHIPVQLRAQIGVGTIIATLSEIGRSTD
jgi:Protein of unknown function (DUF3108)